MHCIFNHHKRIINEKANCRVEISALDFERAVNFYTKALELNLQIVDCGKDKIACFPGGEGAISFTPEFLPSKNGTLVSLDVGKEIDSSLNLVQNHGALDFKPKTKIEADGRGYFADFIDSEGNKIGLDGNE